MIASTTSFNSIAAKDMAMPMPALSTSGSGFYAGFGTSASSSGFNAKVPPHKKNTRAKATRAKKPDGAPKRPLSAYNLFFRDEREKMLAEVTSAEEAAATGLQSPTPPAVPSSLVTATAGATNSRADQSTTTSTKRKHRRTHGKISFRDMASTIAKRWNETDAADRAPYERIAEKEREVYRAKLEAWKRSNGIATDKKGSSPTSPVPANAGGGTTSNGSRSNVSSPAPPTTTTVPSCPSSPSRSSSCGSIVGGGDDDVQDINQMQTINEDEDNKSPSPILFSSATLQKDIDANQMSAPSCGDAATVASCHSESTLPSSNKNSHSRTVKFGLGAIATSSTAFVVAPQEDQQAAQMTNLLIQTISASDDRESVESSCRSLCHFYCPSEELEKKFLSVQQFPLLLPALDRVISLGPVCNSDTLLYVGRMLHHLSTFRENLNVMAMSKSTITSLMTLIVSSDEIPPPNMAENNGNDANKETNNSGSGEDDAKKKAAAHRYAVRALVRLGHSTANRPAIVKILVDYVATGTTNLELKAKVQKALCKLVMML